jgi:murein L,D-transpeptidase YcbB/YkuD
MLVCLLLFGCGSVPSASNAEQAGGESGAESPGAKTAGQTKPHTEASPLAIESPKSAHEFAQALTAFWAGDKPVDMSHDVRKRLELHIGHMRRFRPVVTAAYTARNHGLFSSRLDGLTDEGRLAASLILDVESHGLEPSVYPIDDMKKLHLLYDKAMDALRTARRTGFEDNALFEALSGIVDAPSVGEVQVGKLEKALLAADLHDELNLGAYMATLKKRRAAILEAQKALLPVLVDMDVLIVQGFLQYALDFKHLIVAHPFRAVKHEQKYRAAKKHQEALKEALIAAGENLGKAMRSYWPTHPFYAKTRSALHKYRAMVAADSVPAWKHRRRLKKKSHGKEVIQLKKRLASEGFFGGDMASDTFDEELEASVKHYQETHQLTPTGVVQNGRKLAHFTNRSLNVSMSHRVKTLQLSLQRWRESISQADGYYVRVNIPQFEVEVWDEGKRIRTHKVIVGNNRYEVDEATGRKGRLNRTAIMNKTIETAVFNPVWRVPERIRVNELEKARETNPEYYQQHGYREKIHASGLVRVWQVSGRRNALGKVKLLFPNHHAIYMHDTPKKKLFKRTIRAFSHGCMRLHNPIEFVKFLINRDGGMTDEEIEKVLRTNRERGVAFKAPVAIHVEYNTVTFSGDDATPTFLNDIYKYDRRYWRGAVPTRRSTRIPIRNPLENVNETGGVIESVDTDAAPTDAPSAPSAPSAIEVVPSAVPSGDTNTEQPVPLPGAIAPSPEVSPAPSPEVSPAPSPEVSPAPSPEVSPAPSPEVSPAPSPEVSPVAPSTPEPEPTSPSP